MFRKIAIAAVAAVSLAACGGTKTVYVVNTDAPDTTVKKSPATTEAPAPTLPPWTTEDEFIYDIESNYYGTIYVPDYELIETGRLICEALLGGASGDEVAWAIVGAGGDTELITAVVSSSVVNFCPSQIYKFESLR